MTTSLFSVLFVFCCCFVLVFFVLFFKSRRARQPQATWHNKGFTCRDTTGFVHACVRACERVCVRARACVCVCVCVCVFWCTPTAGTPVAVNFSEKVAYDYLCEKRRWELATNIFDISQLLIVCMLGIMAKSLLTANWYLKLSSRGMLN